MDRGFAALVMEHGRPHDLVLELTEHTAVEDYAKLMTRLDHLRRRGVRIAVDDVGAGYANFRHVLRVRPDIIKLDVSLTTEIDRDPSCRALAAGLVAVATELRATVVAEGIETVDQLECLVALGVEHGQGYYLARPGRLEDAVVQRAALS
jgi:EAL domain-containing protein (putative c-di-GMP-specific phosphodiesterase class I)